MWLLGMVCALLFGRPGSAGEEPAPVYGIPRPAPVEEPVEEPQKPQPPASLADSKEWKTLTEAWAYARPLADSGRSTEKQREEAGARLKAAAEAAAALAAMGILNTSEAGLLDAEAKNIRKEIHRNPPTDSMVTRYEPMVLLPAAQQSLARLSPRLPLLRRLVAESRLHKPAIDKVLATIEADLAVLSDEKMLDELRDADKRAEAEQTRNEVRAVLGKLRKLLEESGHS
jgi:hypothetical protein